MLQDIESEPLASDRLLGALESGLARLMRGASLETTVRPTAVAEACAASLASGTSVFITWLPGDARDARVKAATMLRRAGLNPVPHIGARYLGSGAELDELLRRLRGESGVDELLLIGGDTERVNGPFAASLAVLESGALARQGIRRVGLAAYPEGHPRIAGADLDAALEAKIARARASGLATYIVTQFCFEAPPILAWLRRFCVRHRDVPVAVGLAGPARLATLLAYAATCGIGPSVRALRRHAGMARLLTESGPEPILRALAPFAATLGLAPAHIFTFGGIARTARWLDNLAQTVAAPSRS